jgi:hypothetical protein
MPPPLRDTLRDAIMFRLYSAGATHRDIAGIFGATRGEVNRSIERAFTQQLDSDHNDEPRLTLFFPVTPFTPHSHCPHQGPIARGSRLCCAVCHQSGLDHVMDLPGRVPTYRSDPLQEPEPPAHDLIVSRRTYNRLSKDKEGEAWLKSHNVKIVETPPRRLRRQIFT